MRCQGVGWLVVGWYLVGIAALLFLALSVWMMLLYFSHRRKETK
jgi:hypothetical protein